MPSSYSPLSVTVRKCIPYGISITSQETPPERKEWWREDPIRHTPPEGSDFSAAVEVLAEIPDELFNSEMGSFCSARRLLVKK